MSSSVRVVSCGMLDFATQCRDPSMPAFSLERIGTMAHTPHRIGQHHAVGTLRCSSDASIASAGRRRWQQKRIDFLTGNCRLCLPTLFQRIGIMAAEGQPLPTRLHATHRQRNARLRRDRRPELAPQARHPLSGPAVQAGPSVKTTPTRIASGPAPAPSPARLDNWIRMRVAKPSSRPLTYRPTRREPMTARAGPAG
jgi:hypothetical protein